MRLLRRHEIRHKLCLRINELGAYWNYYIQPERRDQQRVVILAQGRTGSTLLEDLLCSSGYFQAHHELFLKRKIIAPVPFILGLSRRCSKNFIFNLKIYHLLQINQNAPAIFIHTLYQHGFQILYLSRYNKLKHSLSRFIALARGNFHKKDSTKEEIKIMVDCNAFVELMKRRVVYDLLSEQVLQDVPCHRVVYEQDLEDPHQHQETVDRIMDYLGLDRRMVYTQYKKINANSIKDIVINYDEFVMCVHAHGWEEFLT